MELNSGFDYEILNSDNRFVIQQRTMELKERLQRTARDIWEIGQKLDDVRSRLKHGQFEAWLKAEFGWSRRTAYNFINVYEAFQENAKFAQINIATSALYLLASPSTPQATRDKFIQQATTGAKVTHKDILKDVSKHKLKPQSSDTSNQPNQVDAQRQAAASEKHAVDLTEVKNQALPALSPTINRYSKPSWFLLERQHLLFCGDTNSQEFINRLPFAAIALGVSAGEWRYDWLTKKAKSTIILDQHKIFEEEVIEQLIQMFSKPKEAVILPWFPSGKIIALVHQLGRVLYTGDFSYERCKHAIAQSGLEDEEVKLL